VPAPEWSIEALSCPHHNRKGFTCTAKPLEVYLRCQARQDVEKRIAAVFVLTPDGHTIAGYYTLSQFSVRLADIPPETARKLAKYPDVPATLLGRLAVGDPYRGQKLGEKLLLDALARSLEHSKGVASFAVIVDAKDESALGFYRKYGFLAFPGTNNRLFLPMGTIEQLLTELK
jgi:predicted GNAT family N-acyltransferase